MTLGKFGSETLGDVEDSLWGRCFVFRPSVQWHKAFKDGRERVEDEQQAGHPSASRTESNVARGKAVLDRGRSLNVRLTFRHCAS